MPVSMATSRSRSTRVTSAMRLNDCCKDQRIDLALHLLLAFCIVLSWVLGVEAFSSSRASGAEFECGGRGLEIYLEDRVSSADCRGAVARHRSPASRPDPGVSRILPAASRGVLDASRPRF